MDISEIKRIVKLMEDKGLTEFSMKDANGELLLKQERGTTSGLFSTTCRCDTRCTRTCRTCRTCRGTCRCAHTLKFNRDYLSDCWDVLSETGA